MWLRCNRCLCGYSDMVAEAGDRCRDLSWVPNEWYQARRLGLRVHRRLMCKGRLWPEGHPGLARRWTREQLQAEHQRLGQTLEA